jgi:hypothetical protein
MIDPIGARARHACTDAYGILRLAWTMWRKLRENRDKAHWLDEIRGTPEYGDSFLFSRMSDERGELINALRIAHRNERPPRLPAPLLSRDPLWHDVQREAADVANFAMMIHERARHRRK